MKIEFNPQRKELLLFLASNMAAVTSRAYQHNIKQSMRNSKNLEIQDLDLNDSEQQKGSKTYQRSLKGIQDLACHLRPTRSDFSNVL